MKKVLCVFISLILVIGMAACGAGQRSSEDRPNNWSSSNVNDVIQSKMSEEDAANTTSASEETTEATTAATDATDATAEETTGTPDPNVDVDLTVLSSTMVYSEVYNMMTQPSDYIGKTVKMHGPAASYHDEASDKWYFACIIQDATACCSQGIEFQLAGKKAPDDYPEVGEEICVIGVFDTYMEGENTYCTLKDARMA